SDDLKDKVLQIAEEALDKHQLEREIAAYIKKKLDEEEGALWHVIVGKNFGSYVTHEKGYFIYFYINNLAFLVFKTA
ncbi:dynein light chain SCDLUD_003311, partial [Saccharomycodes ludwigii]|uniref:dynein light chain n=1 Tax=Saccharomycodes ludwigii TaxID=36035 RepID=UPI001E821AED